MLNKSINIWLGKKTKSYWPQTFEL